MKTAILYTVLSIANLVGFVAGILFLPTQVPIHFNASMTADIVGSPWVFTALPGAACLISAGIWSVGIAAKKNRGLIEGLLCVLGSLLAILGWCFLALAASGVEVGERTSFPIVLVTVLPISLILVWIGGFLPKVGKNPYFGIRTRETLKSEKIWKKTQTLGGALYIVAGIVSACVSIAFACISALEYIQYVSAIALVFCALLSTLIAVLYARALARREPPEEKTE